MRFTTYSISQPILFNLRHSSKSIMVTLTTLGVQVSVKTRFNEILSNPLESNFFFNYDVELVNHNPFPVQLLTREWYVFDSLSESQYVNGMGVVGEQPVLNPGEKFRYTSGCELFSEIGYMKGFYSFKVLETSRLFDVSVPQFMLEFVGKMN